MKSAKGAAKKSIASNVKSSLKSSPLPKAAPASATTIEAKIDVGFGNAIFARGQGGGLTWTKGVPLTCFDRETWKLAVSTNEKVTFKLLLNDSVWACGEDIVGEPGQKITVMPAFCPET